MTENPVEVDDRYGAGDGIVHTSSTSIDDGSGVFSDYYSTIQDGVHDNWVGLGLDVASDALDTLGFCEDPLQGLISAGIGWLIEHVSFLSEPLDYLAGNPDFVQQKAQTWKNIKDSLTSASQDYQSSAQALAQQYQGTAATAYETASAKFTAGMVSTASHADNAATAMTVAAAIVGTTRGLVRDWISTFVSAAIEKAAVALATSFLDFGASLAAYIADEVVEGSILAEKTASKLTQLTSELKSLASAAEKDAATLTSASSSLAKDASKLSKATTSTVKDVNSSVKTAKTTAEDALKSAKTAGYTRAATTSAVTANRAAAHGLEQTLGDVTELKNAAATASRADGVGRASTALGNNASAAGKTERNIQGELDKLTEQRRELTARRLHVSDENIKTMHEPIDERLKAAAIDATKETGKGAVTEIPRQAVTEREARSKDSQEEQDERGDVDDGSLVTDD